MNDDIYQQYAKALPTLDEVKHGIAMEAEEDALLPTKAEVLAAFAESAMGMPDLIVEEPLDEFEVIFRASPTWAKELDGEVELNADIADAQQPIERLRRFAGEQVRCELCQRRAGEVTLVALRANGKKTGHHRCAGGCASQSSLLTALNRQKRLMPRVTL